MIKLAKAFYRGFVGGPNFENCVHHRLILEDRATSLSMYRIVMSQLYRLLLIYHFPIIQQAGLTNIKKTIYIMNTCICSLKIGCIYHQ